MERTTEKSQKELNRIEAGNTMRDIRLKVEGSRRKFAMRIGIDQAYLAKIEAGSLGAPSHIIDAYTDTLDDPSERENYSTYIYLLEGKAPRFLMQYPELIRPTLELLYAYRRFRSSIPNEKP